MSAPFVLYCKSYRTDLRRVVRLAQSITRFNTERLPFYISVPATDLQLFKKHLRVFPAEIISDESILANTPGIKYSANTPLPGHISQQVVKSGFWRLNLCQTYLCLDSDAQFIRPFSTHDYLCKEGIPYTVIDEGREYLESCLIAGINRSLDNFSTEANSVQKIFSREGKNYSFGPFPLALHRSVWESLDEMFLKPNGLTLMDAIKQAPLESRWYGEALLKFKAIPLIPCQPFFKVYHYAWQMDQDRKAGINNECLARLYSGIIYQSSWDRELDWPQEGGNTLSRWARRMRRLMGRI